MEILAIVGNKKHIKMQVTDVLSTGNPSLEFPGIFFSFNLLLLPQYIAGPGFIPLVLSLINRYSYTLINTYIHSVFKLSIYIFFNFINVFEAVH